jgi:hypothetical protein
MAYNSDNKEFMSHAILQKWVTRKFYGEMTPRDLTWGFFTYPESFKVNNMNILFYLISFLYI